MTQFFVNSEDVTSSKLLPFQGKPKKNIAFFVTLEVLNKQSLAGLSHLTPQIERSVLRPYGYPHGYYL